MSETSLTHFSRARAELAQATKIDEVKVIRDKAQALRAYAQQQGESLEMQNQCAEIKIRAERRAGELLKESAEIGQRDKGRGGDRKSQSADVTVKLADIGISKNQSSDWQKIAAIPEDVFEKHVEETKVNKGELTTAGTLRLTNKPHVAHATGENEWYTPPEYIEAARTVMGGIDCDPASSAIANRTVRAKKFFTIHDDGLKQTWGKSCWLNPPYAQPLVAQFAEAVSAKYESGEIQEACVLVNNATETKWFQRMLRLASAVCWVTGRIKFLDTDGQASGAPLQGQAILYFGENKKAFVQSFKGLGCVR